MYNHTPTYLPAAVFLRRASVRLSVPANAGKHLIGFSVCVPAGREGGSVRFSGRLAGSPHCSNVCLWLCCCCDADAKAAAVYYSWRCANTDPEMEKRDYIRDLMDTHTHTNTYKRTQRTMDGRSRRPTRANSVREFAYSSIVPTHK